MPVLQKSGQPNLHRNSSKEKETDMRMSLHKLFKEMQKLDEVERDLLFTALQEHKNVQRICSDLGIRYSDKMVAKYAVNRYANNSVITSSPTVNVTTKQTNNAKKLEQIILGDNLDIIEEAARKKGLL